ncbi:glycosyltransferase [Psychrobacter sp. Ps6]|uniref:glycosyltransferase n=1 Tax=Psychrobacter sp. Ps6 TaxID=2790960 RepID=UPI001EDC942E|nr:glycosyltransferase [Psychrobacter sp. Ps6]MCG3879589.1 glycosyltransferase [Psychrobacter sp. Ps6]
MTQNDKIVFFVNSLDSGGIENYLLRFLKENHSNFKNIYVYCKSGKGGQLENAYSEIINLVIIKKEIGFFNYRNTMSLNSFFVDNEISSVCDFTGNFSGLVLLVAHKAGIHKRVAFYRSSTNRFKSDIFRNSYDRLVKMMVKKYATDILSNSKAGLDYFFSKYWENDSRFEIIKNGINAELFLKESGNLRQEFSIPDTAFVVGHTGRYNPAKNHKTILSVAEILVKNYDDIYFILCGNGVKNNLQDILKTKKLDSRILVFENRSDISKFLNTMDCYFFPSITEGQPNALIEAMMIGLPYVASNIESIKETVLDLKNLYNPKDIDSFVKALELNYKNRPQKNVLYQQQVIEKFDADKCFNAFYERLFI